MRVPDGCAVASEGSQVLLDVGHGVILMLLILQRDQVFVVRMLQLPQQPDGIEQASGRIQVRKLLLSVLSRLDGLQMDIIEPLAELQGSGNGADIDAQVVAGVVAGSDALVM